MTRQSDKWAERELLKPQRTVKRCAGPSWYYVFRGHVDVVHRVNDNAGNYLRTEQVRIGSRKLYRLLGLALITKKPGGKEKKS